MGALNGRDCTGTIDNLDVYWVKEVNRLRCMKASYNGLSLHKLPMLLLDGIPALRE